VLGTVFINLLLNLIKHLNERKMQPYQRFIGAAFQMLATILLGVWLGQYLDGYFKLHQPWCTISLSLGSIAISLYALIKSLPK
jgi:F0F1-type ATP synthase assembly protein I